MVSVHSGLHADLSKPSMILTPICFGLPANLFRWVLTWDGQLNHILQWFPFCNDHITLGGPRKVWPALSGFLPFAKKLIPDLGFQRINTCRKVLDIYRIYWIYWTGCTESTGFTGYTELKVLDTGMKVPNTSGKVLDWKAFESLNKKLIPCLSFQRIIARSQLMMDRNACNSSPKYKSNYDWTGSNAVFIKIQTIRIHVRVQQIMIAYMRDTTTILTKTITNIGLGSWAQ